MAGAIAAPVRGTGRSMRTKALIFVVVAVAVIAAFSLYVYYTVSSIKVMTTSGNYMIGRPSVTASIASQNLLSYSNGSVVLPYSLLSYSARNASSLTFNITMFSSRLPSGVYVLNTSGECFNCGYTPTITGALANSLVSYGITTNQSAVSLVPIYGVSSLPNYSIVVILSGLLPAQLVTANGTGPTPMQRILNKGISVIYVGRNFSHLLLPGSIVIPWQNLSSYLSTSPTGPNVTKGFNFNASTFAFSGGYRFGALTYIRAYNGTIVAFPNVPTTWSSPAYIGNDIAKAIQKLFWVPKYSSGFLAVNLSSTPSASGSAGVLESIVNFSNSKSAGLVATALDRSFGRLLVTANPAGSSANATYSYTFFTPRLSVNGTLYAPTSLVPNQQVPVTMTIFTRSQAPIQIEPHLSVYTLNMSSVTAIGLPFTTASGNFTFVKYLSFAIGPGKYIMVLDSFTNTQYAAAYFTVPQVNIALPKANFSQGAFTFLVTSAGVPLTGVDYNITLNKLYQSSGTINNGTLVYTLPKGTPTVSGTLTFSINMLQQQFSYVTSNNPPPLQINGQYIELAIVGIVVLLMVVLVRSPNRDEFYIDVPSLPERKKIEIRLSAKELMSTFDRLNMHYHWRYMPLTSSEARVAITSNVRYNNMPVGLTNSNVESMLNQLVVRSYVVSADELYAPKAWIEQSGHDIEYLATFKKLRLWLVTHAYQFTDIDTSNIADIVATLRGERRYIVIGSKTTRFKNVPVYEGSKSLIAFLNADKLEEFRNQLYSSTMKEAEVLKTYISSGEVTLVDADSPGELS